MKVLSNIYIKHYSESKSIKMTSFLNVVPRDITIDIANHLDIKSFSKFLTTCKYANENTKQAFNNKVCDNIENMLKEIIKTVANYNKLLLITNNKYLATQEICKSVFKNILDAQNATDMDYLLTLLDGPVKNIMELIDGTQQDVHHVLNQIVSEDTLEEEFQQQVLRAVQEYLFTGVYNVVFALLDNKNTDVRYRFLMNINLSGDIPEVRIMMIDEANDIDLCDNEFSDSMNDYIKDAGFTADGEVAFIATDESIKGLSKYICKVFGNGVFTHNLTNDGVQIQICNFLNQPFECCAFYRKVVSAFPITRKASSRITNHFSSNSNSNIV